MTDQPPTPPRGFPSEEDAADFKPASLAVRTTVLVLELAFIGALLGIWLLVDEVRESRSLWILFLYSFPSEFLVAPVPHEPIFFYFGKYYAAWLVAGIAVASTVLTEALNYHIFGYFADRSFFEKIHRSRVTRKVVEWFYRAPFTALIIVGLSPIPFYPMRFVVVLARYPLWKYCLAVFLSRAPRFWVLAWLGAAVSIPNWLLVVVFTVLILGINVPLLLGIVRQRRQKE